MNCERVHDLLSEAVDGTLPSAEAARFSEHLGACPPCRALFGEVKEALALLEDLPAVQPREGFDEAVWVRVRADRARRARVAGWLDRVAGGMEAFFGARAWMRWAPLGTAAALLAWVAVSPQPFGFDRAGSPLAARGVAPGATDLAAADEAAAAGGEDFAAAMPGEPVVDPEFTPVEYPAGMPKAVEALLESESSSRELRLNPDRYRRSNWHYPLRPVRDPLGGAVTPVSGGSVRHGASPHPAGAASGVPVLSF